MNTDWLVRAHDHLNWALPVYAFGAFTAAVFGAVVVAIASLIIA